MSNKFTLAMGLMRLDEDQKDKSNLSAFSVIRKINAGISAKEIDKDDLGKALVEFESYDDAEAFLGALYRLSYQYESDDPLREHILYYVVIVYDTGLDNAALRASNVLNDVMKQVNRDRAIQSCVFSYVTREVYQGLAQKHKDLYHPATEIGSRPVHERYLEEILRCFVISPIGPENSAIRRRADYVFETYIKPACEGTGFRPVRDDMQHGAQITPAQEEAIQSDPMAIVYLGPSLRGFDANDTRDRVFNNNVIFEYGLRARSGAPYVLIKDTTADGQPYNLPFDFKDDKAIDIPEQPEPDSKECLERKAIKIRTIQDQISNLNRKSEWDYLLPGATVDIKVGDPNTPPRYTEVSKELEDLFEFKKLKGKDSNIVMNHLLQKMPPRQREPFILEQKQLIADIFLRQSGSNLEDIKAKIPIVFGRDSRYCGRAVLPLIVRYTFNSITNTFRLRVLYVDVTASTRLDKVNDYWICQLTGEELLDWDEKENNDARPTHVPMT